MEKQGVKTRDLVEMALFAAIIVILAFTPLGYIPLGVITPTTVNNSSKKSRNNSWYTSVLNNFH